MRPYSFDDVTAGQTITSAGYNAIQDAIEEMDATGTDFVPALSDLDPPTASVDLDDQKIVNLGTPSADADAATKAYVDGVASGLGVKDSVRAATTANITLSGAQTIDGVAIIAGDRVLVKDQSSGAQNGIYVAASGAWSRSADANQDAEVTTGMFTLVTEGTTNAAKGFVLTTPDPITVGSTALTFSQFNQSAPSSLSVQDEGVALVTAASALNFVGAAVSATGAGSTKTITFAIPTVHARLPYAPPPLTTPTTIDLGPAGSYWRQTQETSGGSARITLSAGVDYILQFPTDQVRPYTVRTSGGRNIRVIGGHSAIGVGNGGTDNTIHAHAALHIENFTGSVFVEGFLVTNPNSVQFDGIKINASDATTNDSRAYVQNCRVTDLIGASAGVHSDCVQLQKIRHFFFHNNTFMSYYQAFLGENQNGYHGGGKFSRCSFHVPNTASKSWAFYIEDTASMTDTLVELDDVWVYRGGAADEQQWGVNPSSTASSPYTAVKVGNAIHWPNVSSNIKGIARIGLPAVDFVAAANVGYAYVSPGYVGV